MVLAKAENVKADMIGRPVLADTKVECDKDIARWCACCGSAFMSRIGTCDLIGALHQRPGESAWLPPCVVLLINDNLYGLMFVLSYTCKCVHKHCLISICWSQG